MYSVKSRKLKEIFEDFPSFEICNDTQLNDTKRKY